jgi:tetratricopeptide (TPR) repeat protein
MLFPFPVAGRTLCALLVGLASAGLSLSAVAQDSSGAVPNRALTTIDSLRINGDFDGALSRLTTLRDRRGNQVEILWRMSLTKVDSAKVTDNEDRVKTLYRDALTLADEALAADSSSARAHYAKAVAEGRIALDAGTKERVRRSRAVKRHADRAIELDPALDEPYHVRARWHREVDDLGFLERVVVKTVYGGLPDASAEQAVRDFKRAIELADKRFHRLELAKTYMQMDREDEAQTELRTVLEMDPRGPFDQEYARQAKQLLKELR